MVVQLQQSIIVVAFVHAVWFLLAVLSVVNAAARAAQAEPSSTGAEHFLKDVVAQLQQRMDVVAFGRAFIVFI
jgi:hypothetical protein